MWEQISDFSLKYEVGMGAPFPIRSIAFDNKSKRSSIKVKRLSLTRTYAGDTFTIICRSHRCVKDLKKILTQNGFNFLIFNQNGICIKDPSIDVLNRCINTIAKEFDTHISFHIQDELNAAFDTPLIEEEKNSDIEAMMIPNRTLRYSLPLDSSLEKAVINPDPVSKSRSLQP